MRRITLLQQVYNVELCIILFNVRSCDVLTVLLNMIVYNLIVPGIPGDLFVNEINSTAITVSWVEPSITNGIITMYEIVYSLGNHSVLDDDATIISVMATVNTSYEIIIGGLDHFTVYTVAVRAYTRVGGGNLTDTFNILTDPFSKYLAT